MDLVNRVERRASCGGPKSVRPELKEADDRRELRDLPVQLLIDQTDDGGFQSAEA